MEIIFRVDINNEIKKILISQSVDGSINIESDVELEFTDDEYGLYSLSPKKKDKIIEKTRRVKIIETTDEEKRKKYQKLNKKDLIEIIINCNKMIKILQGLR